MTRRGMRWTALVLGTLLATAAPALAEDDESEPKEFGRTGLYVGVSGGYAYDWNGTVPVFGGAMSNVRSSGSPEIGIRLGYRLQPPLAVELEFDYLTGAASTSTSVTGAYPAPFPPSTTSTAFEIRGLKFTPNVRIYLLPGWIQPFAVVGVGLMWTELTDFASPAAASFGERSEVSTLVRAGGGLAVRIDETFSIELGAEYMSPYEANNAFDHVSFSGALVYQF